MFEAVKSVEICMFERKKLQIYFMTGTLYNRCIFGKTDKRIIKVHKDKERRNDERRNQEKN